MKLCVTSAALVVFAFATLAPAQTPRLTLPLWPHALPEPAQTTDAEVDVTKPTDALINGRRSARLTNVTHPTLTLYSSAPGVKNTGAAALVFPGGGYVRLAWDGEGIATCDWLTSIGVSCILVKYRVPEQGHYPDNPADLEDAQQAMRLTRQHATEWAIDRNRIGVVGFSAGGNLAVLMSTHPDDQHVEHTPAAPDTRVDMGGAEHVKITGQMDARANFAIVGYPAYLIKPDNTLDRIYKPNQYTPPTFLIQAENDKGYGKNAPVYYQALAEAGIQADLHMYATGGHGFGITPLGRPEEHWTDLATAWLRTIKMIP